MNKFLKFCKIITIIFVFIIINLLILFFAIAVPKINIKNENGNDYDKTKLEFSVECKIPIKNVKVSIDGVDIPYKFMNNKYYVDANINGTVKISVTALNGIESVYNYSINQLDDTLPTIDDQSVSITAGILTFSVSDTQSGINYDSIFAIDQYNKKIMPSYINKELGIIQFKMDTDTLTVHIEDNSGNSTETIYKAK